METTKLTSKGQVVIPKPIRDQLHLLAGTEFKVTGSGTRIIMEPLTKKTHKLADWSGFKSEVKHLTDKEAFAPVDMESEDDRI
jgi:AbrB family looped-hinge helix DNA binding protein